MESSLVRVMAVSIDSVESVDSVDSVGEFLPSIESGEMYLCFIHLCVCTCDCVQATCTIMFHAI